MQQTTTNRADLEETPAVTPLCESYPPRFASEAYGGRSTISSSAAHQTEFDVCRELMAENGVVFDSLVVRRIRDGVCLQGYVEFDDQPHNLEEVARRVAGVDQVLNHLVVVDRRMGIPR